MEVIVKHVQYPTICRFIAVNLRLHPCRSPTQSRFNLSLGERLNLLGLGRAQHVLGVGQGQFVNFQSTQHAR